MEQTKRQESKAAIHFFCKTRHMIHIHVWAGNELGAKTKQINNYRLPGRGDISFIA